MSDLAPGRFPQPDRGWRGQAGRRSKGSSECASSQSRRYPPVSCGRCGQRWMNSTLPSRARDVYCRGAVMSLLWPTICEVVKAAHGFICSHCIASTLALPGPLVTMATLGLSRLGGVEAGEEVCARCRMRRRVIRSCEEPDHASGVIAASFAIQPRDDPGDYYS